MTSDGEVQRCEVSGRLEVRTDGSACRRVDVSLAEDVKLLEAGAPGEYCSLLSTEYRIRVTAWCKMTLTAKTNQQATIRGFKLMC